VPNKEEGTTTNGTQLRCKQNYPSSRHLLGKYLFHL
jgi:hypothetical protein